MKNSKMTELLVIVGIGIVLIAAFKRCSGKNSFAKNYKQKISSVLQQDFQCAAKTPSEKYRKMCAISLEGCPVDFCEAYSKHKEAWYGAVKLIEEAEAYAEKQNSLETAIVGFLEGFVGGLCGDLTYGYDRAMDRHNAACNYFYEQEKVIYNQINNTYQKCLRIADSYGIDVGKYY